MKLIKNPNDEQLSAWLGEYAPSAEHGTFFQYTNGETDEVLAKLWVFRFYNYRYEPGCSSLTFFVDSGIVWPDDWPDLCECGGRGYVIRWGGLFGSMPFRIFCPGCCAENDRDKVYK